MLVCTVILAPPGQKIEQLYWLLYNTIYRKAEYFVKRFERKYVKAAFKAAIEELAQE
jgi:hypothetical protein